MSLSNVEGQRNIGRVQLNPAGALTMGRERPPQIERHFRFPNGVNAGYMQIADRANIRLRVWERGVGETLACGTGACAAVVSEPFDEA